MIVYYVGAYCFTLCVCNLLLLYGKSQLCIYIFSAHYTYMYLEKTVYIHACMFTNIHWHIHVHIHTQLFLSEIGRTTKKEINAISLDFEIPMYICSGLTIRFLRVMEKGKSSSYMPYRWVRYITHR